MADPAATPTTTVPPEGSAPPDADLPIEDFIARGNARDKGEEPPEPQPVADADADKTTGEKKLDGRTREGRKKSIQQEIDELAAAKHATRAEVESAKTELGRLQRELAALNGRKEPAAPAPRPQPRPEPAQQDGTDARDPEPTLEDYREAADPYTAWVRACAAWESRKEHRIFLREQNERHAAASAEHHWRQKLADAKARIPDFEKRLDPDLPVDVRVMPFIQRRENAGEVLVYLSEHQDEARALLSLDPIEQIGRIGEIVGVLKSRTAAVSNGPAPKPQPISRANPPTKPLDASPMISSDDGDDANDTSEAAVLRHFERENKREAARLRGR